MTKFLIFSDLHLHPFQAFHKIVNGVNSRLLEIANVLDTIIDLAHKENCDAILFGGDFFHTRIVERETLALAGSILKKSEIPIIAISGNHDQSKDALYSAVESLRGLVTILNNEEITIAGTNIRGIPYTTNKIEIKEEPDILLLHTGIGGAKMGADFVDNTSRPLEEINRLANIVICGHFHLPQLFKNPPIVGGFVLIPGSPVQHNFGDEGQDRGCWILDNENLRFEPISGPTFGTMTEEESKEPSEINYVRIKKKEEVFIPTRIKDIEKSNPHDALRKYCEFKNKTHMINSGVDILNKAIKKDEI
jgi:DNA repair exonuclease SbcCD nuclease subunit